MIAPNDNNRILVESKFLETAHQPSEARVHEANRGVVAVLQEARRIVGDLPDRRMLHHVLEVVASAELVRRVHRHDRRPLGKGRDAAATDHRGNPGERGYL